MKPLKIICNETGEIFSSLTEASNTLNVTMSNLSRHLKGAPGRVSVSGYSFSYLDSSVPRYTEDQIKKLVNDKRDGDRKYWASSGHNRLERNREYKKGWLGNGGREKEALYRRERVKKDPGFRMIRIIRKRHWCVINGVTSTTRGLGCDSNFLKSYIEKLWGEDMSWDNYGYGTGKWVIDHVIPLASYEKTREGGWDPESLYNKKLIHYTNLQPLWYDDNLKKGDTIDPDDLAVFLERVIEL